VRGHVQKVGQKVGQGGGGPLETPRAGLVEAAAAEVQAEQGHHGRPIGSTMAPKVATETSTADSEPEEHYNGLSIVLITYPNGIAGT
jgi:hypothetical protein